MLQIKEITSKKIWDTFLYKTYKDFLPFFQSWEWGEVQHSLSHTVKRFGIYKNSTLLGVFLSTEVNARRGRYIHLRHGPVLEKWEKEIVDFLFDEIKKYGKKHHFDFIRISPLVDETKVAFLPFSFASPIHNMDAEICWVLSLDKSEDDILKDMRKSHRYLIKKAQSLPITIRQTINPNDFSLFLPLYKQLAYRKHFVPHSGVLEELKIFAKENMASLFLAEYEGKIISAALIDFVGDTAIYRHSASDENFRNIPAMYFLQWEVIKEAKKRGMKYYNFWGIAPTENVKHPWFGLSLFKKGFGGEERRFLHARDIPLSVGYIKAYAVDYLTKLRKGY
ncbi:MAG TPA: peptidoglycan bridge formation glycyltransferase FemA/FemB family protein [Patescibacteria group bacterium]